jgi:hypothetical protein
MDRCPLPDTGIVNVLVPHAGDGGRCIVVGSDIASSFVIIVVVVIETVVP